MTLNGVMAVISRYYTEFGSFGANYVKPLKIDQQCLGQNAVASVGGGRWEGGLPRVTACRG